MSYKFSPEDAEAIDAEIARRTGKPTTGKSVLEPTQEEGALQTLKNTVESVFKGGARGLIDIIGGYGNLYDYLKQSKEPNAFSSAGIAKAVQDLSGINLQRVQPGYTGMFEFSRAGTPAAVFTGLGVPGLFSRTPAGVAGEFGVAGTTGVLAQTVAPESPLSQLAIQSSPYAMKGGLGTIQSRMTRPIGEIAPETADLLSVGRMTPGEATGSRRQLATEQRVETSPSIEAKGTEFRQAQATDVESYLTKLFDRASSKAITDPQALTDTLSTSFQNFGKALSSKLQSDAKRDFGQASKTGGQIDVTAVKSEIDNLANSLPTAPGLEGLRSSLSRLSTELEANRSMPIDVLQKELSAWGKAAWSGEYALKGSDIFAGVAPGQVKGIARQVLRSYKDALDTAIQSNVSGAAELKMARDNFSSNLAKIDEFADRPIVKAFGKPTNQLVPETDVIPVLRDMPQTQRKLLFDIVGQQSPDIADSIRRLQFDDVLGSSVNYAAAKNEPTFVIDKALDALNKKNGDLSFLFPNVSDLNDAVRAIKYMKTVLQSSQGGVETMAPGVTAYGITRGAGAASGTANAVSQVASAIRDFLANPNAFADVIFNKDTVNSMLELQKSTTVDKAINVLSNIGKATSVQAARSGPRMGREGAQPQEPISQPDFTAEEIEKEIERRKGQ